MGQRGTSLLTLPTIHSPNEPRYHARDLFEFPSQPLVRVGGEHLATVRDLEEGHALPDTAARTPKEIAPIATVNRPFPSARFAAIESAARFN
jgi:hypothetical protein